MVDIRARKILSSLLMEKGAVPRDGADIRQLLVQAISTGDLSGEVTRALAETFNVVAAATQTTASKTGSAANPDGTSSDA